MEGWKNLYSKGSNVLKMTLVLRVQWSLGLLNLGSRLPTLRGAFMLCKKIRVRKISPTNPCKTKREYRYRIWHPGWREGRSKGYKPLHHCRWRGKKPFIKTGAFPSTTFFDEQWGLGWEVLSQRIVVAVNGSKFDRLCFCDAGRPESLVTFGKSRISKGCKKYIVSVASSCCWGMYETLFFLGG